MGLKSSFVNFNLKDDALVHSISISNCKALIFDVDFLDHILAVKKELIEKGVQKFYCFGDEQKVKEISDWATDLERDSLNESTSKLPEKIRSYNNGVKFSDVVAYIFTSGTTGLPKAGNSLIFFLIF